MTSTDSISGSLPDAAAAAPRGLLLVLNNCEDRLQIVLGESFESDVQFLSARELVVPGRTAGFLIPAIGEMIREQEREIADIAGIACTRGPGSFTGIRLALSAASGLQAGCGALLAGLDFLPLVAAAPARVTERNVYALTYARRGQVYMQGFAAGSQAITDVLPLTAAEAADLIASETPAVLVGTGLHKNIHVFQPLADKGHTLLGQEWSHPKPDGLLAAAAMADYGMDALEPEYGRKADAEDNLDEIARKRGIDPAQARRLLDESRKG